MISGDECGPNFLTFVLRLRENPGKNLNKEIDPTGDRTRARCIRSDDVTLRPWSMEKWWNEICGKEKGEKPEKNLSNPRYVNHETHMEWPRLELRTPSGGKRGTNRLRHEAAPTYPKECYSITFIPEFSQNIRQTLRFSQNSKEMKVAGLPASYITHVKYSVRRRSIPRHTLPG